MLENLAVSVQQSHGKASWAGEAVLLDPSALSKLKCGSILGRYDARFFFTTMFLGC